MCCVPKRHAPKQNKTEQNKTRHQDDDCTTVLAHARVSEPPTHDDDDDDDGGDDGDDGASGDVGDGVEVASEAWNARTRQRRRVAWGARG